MAKCKALTGSAVKGLKEMVGCHIRREIQASVHRPSNNFEPVVSMLRKTTQCDVRPNVISPAAEHHHRPRPVSNYTS